MIRLLLIIIVLVFGAFFERLERENSFIFWAFSILLVVTFSSFGNAPTTSSVIEQNISLVLAINPGGKYQNRNMMFSL